MSRGIYVLADDGALDAVLALVASLRARDAGTPIALLPYSERCERLLEVLPRLDGVRMWRDLPRLRRLERTLRRAFGRGFFPRPGNLRKWLCWMGPFEEFLYLDADILVFERVADALDELGSHDFICYSDQHLGGTAHVFHEAAFDEGLLPASQRSEVFNAGFFASRRGLFSEAEIHGALEECARHRHVLDRSRGGSDQPVLNFVVLRKVARRKNLYRHGRDPGMWAGREHFVRDGDRLVDPEVARPLRFLHWAGMRIEPGAPYHDLWRHYRSRYAEIPLAPPARGAPPGGPREGALRRARSRLSDALLAPVDRRRLRRPG